MDAKDYCVRNPTFGNTVIAAGPPQFLLLFLGLTYHLTPQDHFEKEQ